MPGVAMPSLDGNMIHPRETCAATLDNRHLHEKNYMDVYMHWLKGYTHVAYAIK